MAEWHAWRSFAVVMLVVGAFSATTIVSCGGGSGTDSNGALCEQCGDTDGPCNIAGDDIEPGQAAFPSFCTDPETTCHVQLICTRKLDSAQRRCFPADSGGALDLRYECDGSRPGATPAPTATTTPTATPSASSTPTPTTTSLPGQTATPTPTPTLSATPAATATPAAAGDVSVEFDVVPSADDVTGSFTITIKYDSTKGNFGGSSNDCNSDVDAVDNGSGTLTVTYPADDTGFSEDDFSCTFHQLAGKTLIKSDLMPASSNAKVTVSVVDITT